MLKAVYDQDIDNIIDLVIAHKTSHQGGGSDEISVAGLAGVLTAAQPSTWAQVAGKPSTFAPSAHKTSHQDGGTDEINVTGLVGIPVGAILGDGTAGRAFRGVYLNIDNGGGAAQLKCTIGSRWNGDAIAETDNIAKNATTGHFALDAGGEILTVLNAGLTGDVLFALGIIYRNYCQTDITAGVKKIASGIQCVAAKTSDGSSTDWTGLVDLGIITVHILYITTA